MIERRPYLSVVRHAVLIVAVAVILFPVYVAFVASTLSFAGGAARSHAAAGPGATCWRTTPP